MNKEELTRRVVEILTRAGFTLSERCNIRPRSFDLAARRQDILLLLRVFSNVDGLNAPTALAMKHLSGCLNGSPLVIGSRSRNQVLEDGVAYFRHGIPSISPTTLYDCFVEGVPPLIYAAPGGLYVSIDGEHLKNIRIAQNISLGELATELGISRRTISKYEEEEMDASVDVVLRLEEVLNSGFVCPIRIFSTGPDRATVTAATPTSTTAPTTAPTSASGQSEPGEVSLLLTPLGFFVVPAKQAPFAAVSDDGVCNTMLTGISGYNRTMAKNAHLMSSISVVAGTKSLYIVKGGCKHTHIDDTVLIKESEFKKIDDHDDVMQLIQERSIDRGDIT